MKLSFDDLKGANKQFHETHEGYLVQRVKSSHGSNRVEEFISLD